jgi:hypothetical protein
MGDNIGRIRHLIDYESVLERGASLQWAIQSCKLIEAGVPVNLQHERRARHRLGGRPRLQPGRSRRHDRRRLGGHRHGHRSGGGTTITVPVNLPANSIVGQMVVTTSGATRFGIVQSNTSATNSVITIDRLVRRHGASGRSRRGVRLNPDRRCL